SLFDLLLPGFVCILFCELLMVPFLLLLKSLPIFLLLRKQLFLLFLVFLVLLRIAGVWRTGTLHWRQLAGMHRVSTTRGIVSGRGIAWPCVASSCVSWTP